MPEHEVLDDVQAEQHPVVAREARLGGERDSASPIPKHTDRLVGHSRPRAASRRTPVM